MFIDDHEQPNMVEDQNCFLIKIEELKLYIIEFNKDSTIKAKDYPVDCAIGEKKHYPIIVITYNEYTFSANNRIWKHGLKKKTHFYNLKNKARGL